MFTGIITALVTPFNQEGDIDYTVASQLIEHLIDQGVDGLFILGTNGEFTSLSAEERVAFADFVVKQVSGRIKVYVGAGECGTKETVRMAQAIAAVGPDAISLITPFYAKLSQEEIYQHYLQVIQALDVPVILYNIPGVTGNKIEPETLDRLCDLEAVKGIKDSSGDLTLLAAYQAIGEKHGLDVLVGSDSKILEGLKMGVSGAVSGLSNAIAPAIIAIYDRFQAGDLEGAAEAQAGIEPFRLGMKCKTAPAGIKAALKLQGIGNGATRLPILPTSPEDDETIRPLI